MTDDELEAAESALDARLARVIGQAGPVGGWEERRLLVALEAIMDDDQRRRYRERWVESGNEALDAVERALRGAVLLRPGGAAPNGRH